MEFNPEKAVDVVKACEALHNMLTLTDASTSLACKYIPPNFADGITAMGEQLPGEWRKACVWAQQLGFSRKNVKCTSILGCSH